MAVDIPTDYDTTGLTVGVGIGSQIPITSSPIRGLANNHNFMGGHYCPPAFYGASYHKEVATGGTVYGMTSEIVSASTWIDISVMQIPSHSLYRDLAFGVVAYRLDLTSTHKFRIRIGSTYSPEVTISAVTPTYHSTTITPPAGTHITAVLQIQNTSAVNRDTAVQSWAAAWDRIYGSQSDTPGSDATADHKWMWTQPSQEFSDNEPLTVEQYNRIAGGPQEIYAATPQCVCALADALRESANGYFTTDSTTPTLVANLLICKRRDNQKIRFRAWSWGRAGSVILIQIGNQSCTIGPSSTSAPDVNTGSYTYTFQEAGSLIDLSEEANVTQARIYMTSSNTGDDFNLFSLVGWEEL